MQDNNKTNNKNTTKTIKEDIYIDNILVASFETFPFMPLSPKQIQKFDFKEWYFDTMVMYYNILLEIASSFHVKEEYIFLCNSNSNDEKNNIKEVDDFLDMYPEMFYKKMLW